MTDAKLDVTIDSPAPGAVIREPVKLAGWVSPPAPDSLTVFVGHRGMGGVRWVEREDVRRALQIRGVQARIDEKLGFELLLDLSGLPPGEYELRLEARAGGRPLGTVASRPVLNRPEPRVEIESPADGAEVRGAFRVVGWASPPRPDTLVVHCGDQRVAEVTWEARPDVRESLLAAGYGVRSFEWFGFSAPVDLSRLPEGPLRLRLEARGGRKPSGTVAAVEVHNRRSIRIALETPAPGSLLEGPFCVSGWAAPPLPDALVVYAGSRRLGRARWVDRPDVRASLGDAGLVVRKSDRLGFELPVDPSSIPPGVDRLRIEGVSGGRSIGVLTQIDVLVAAGRKASATGPPPGSPGDPHEARRDGARAGRIGEDPA